MVTGIYLVQIEPKFGVETEKFKDGYRQCGYLPQPHVSFEDALEPIVEILENLFFLSFFLSKKRFLRELLIQ